MASVRRRLSTNVEGDFYVDETCIDCAACRWMAPETFDEAGGRSRVHTQPETPNAVRRALLAVVACPTGSIGAAGPPGRYDVKAAKEAFPIPIADRVYHCGFHSEKSFGAASYLIARDDGNVLVDSPRFNRGLADAIDRLGGISTMFLTHRDDVADHEKWAEVFGAERIIHADDQSRSTKNIERLIHGSDPAQIAPDLTILPTPGHTRGSACLLYDGRFLFSGDHVAYNLNREAVYAFRGACWYDWETQIQSMRRLTRYTFEWILPGHGAPCHFDRATMREQMEACVAWMENR